MCWGANLARLSLSHIIPSQYWNCSCVDLIFTAQLTGLAEFRRGSTAKRRKYAEEVDQEVAKTTRLQMSHYGVLRARNRFTGHVRVFRKRIVGHCLRKFPPSLKHEYFAGLWMLPSVCNGFTISKFASPYPKCLPQST